MGSKPIPPVPVEGDRYSSNGLLGLPLVLEYDESTGGYKLVVATEGALQVTITGTAISVDAVRIRDAINPSLLANVDAGGNLHVSLQTGSLDMSDVQIGAVEIKNRNTDDRAIVDGFGQIYTHWPSGSFAFDSSMTDVPTSGFFPNIVGTIPIGFDDVSGQYRRAQALGYGDGLDTGESRSLVGVNAFQTIRNFRIGVATDNAAVRGSASADEIVGAQTTGEQMVIAKSYHFDPNSSPVNNWRRTRGDSEGRLYTRAFVTGTVSIENILDQAITITGSVDTELPDPVTLSDSLSNPTVPQVGSHLMGYDDDDGHWERVRMLRRADLDNRDNTFVDRALFTNSVIRGVRSDDLGLDRIRGDKETGLHITLTSGSFPGQVASTLMADGIADPRVGFVGSLGMGFDGTNWQRLRVLTTSLPDNKTPVFPLETAGFLYAYERLNNDEWQRVESIDFQAAGNLDDVDFSSARQALSVVGGTYGQHPLNSTDLQLIMSDAHRNLNVTLISGSFPPGASVSIDGTPTVDTELPAAAPLADFSANPTAPAVGSHLMGYNGDGTWSRVYMGISGSIGVELFSQLEADQDEVTAYVTGTVHAIIDSGTVGLETGTVVGLAGQTKGIIRDIISFTGSAGQNVLAAAVGGERIRVLSMMLIASADTEIQFLSGFTGSARSGPLSLPVDGDGFFLNFPTTPDQFHMQTDPGDALVLSEVAGAQIGGWINYYTEA